MVMRQKRMKSFVEEKAIRILIQDEALERQKITGKGTVVRGGNNIDGISMEVVDVKEEGHASEVPAPIDAKYPQTSKPWMNHLHRYGI